jgi:hypothetical protein
VFWKAVFNITDGITPCSTHASEIDRHDSPNQILASSSMRSPQPEKVRTRSSPAAIDIFHCEKLKDGI